MFDIIAPGDRNFKGFRSVNLSLSDVGKSIKSTFLPTKKKKINMYIYLGWDNRTSNRMV